MSAHGTTAARTAGPSQDEPTLSASDDKCEKDDSTIPTKDESLSHTRVPLEQLQTTPVRRLTSTDDGACQDPSQISPELDESIIEKSLPGSGAITPAQDGDDDQATKEEDASSCPRWSEVLKSPTSDARFSPSKDLNKPGSLHGAGLSVAVERAKKLSKCGRRCATLLYDLAALYDTFAQAILKSCQSLQSPPGGANVSGLSVACSKSLMSFAKQMQGLAICIRGSVARPLHGAMTSLAETAPSVYSRYSTTRAKCIGARRKALAMRFKYSKAVREADAMISDSLQMKQKENHDGSESKDPTPDNVDVSFSSTGSDAFGSLHPKGWEKSLKNLGQKPSASSSSDKLLRLLNEVKSLEAQYSKLVAEENKAVSQSQTMEIMALEAVQELEEERLHFFVETMKRTLEAEKGALDKILLSAVETKEPRADFVSKQEKKSNVFTSFLKPNSQFEEGIGIMEAGTLGLPEEVGTLRDQVRACFEDRSNRLQCGKVLSGFLEEVAASCSTFSSALTTRLGQEGYGVRRRTSAPNGLLSVALEKNEGAKVRGFWDGLVTTMCDSAEAATKLSDVLKSARRKILESKKAERELRLTADADDQRWKYLCEAARVEMKAHSRYRQTSDQFEKARDRARSVDDGLNPTVAQRESTVGTPARKNSGMKQGMHKAIGNVFSILPNGGEHAMKIMTPNTRRKIAQTSLEDANEKELKDKQLLDEAVSVRAVAMKSYTDAAKRTLNVFRKEDKVGWDSVRITVESSISSFEEFRLNRYEALSQPSKEIEEMGNIAIIQDMAEWAERAKRHTGKKAEQEADSPKGNGSVLKRTQSDGNAVSVGFYLEVQKEDCQNVYALLSLVGFQGDDSTGPDSSEDDASIPDTTQRGAISDSEVPPDAPPQTAFHRSVTEPLEGSRHKELVALSESLRERIDSGKTEDFTAKHADASALQQTLEVHRSSSPSKAETDVFLAHFWSDRTESETPPTVIESFSCAYWPKDGEGYISPLLHGRMFATSSAMYFVGWGGKKIVLNWKDVTSVKKEKNMMGTIDNALRVSFKSDSGDDSSHFFGSFASRENAFQLIDRLSTIARSLSAMSPDNDLEEDLPPVSPDETLKKMEVVISKKLRNVSVRKFYDVVWSEGNGTESDLFYGPFLTNMGSRKVTVTDWEVAGSGEEGFSNPWDGERYTHKRVVEFEFTRTTHLYVGPPVAQVKQTQYCRVEGNDIVVLEMTVEMFGIPYADCFTVEVRWVARREGARNLEVNVGVFVDFKKSTMFAKKIRSGTIQETKPIHEKLFEAAKKACAAAVGEEPEEEIAEDETAAEAVEKPLPFSIESVLGKIRAVVGKPEEWNATTLFVVAVLLFLVWRAFTYLSGSGSRGQSISMEQMEDLSRRMDEMHSEIREIKENLNEIMSMMKEVAKGAND